MHRHISLTAMGFTAIFFTACQIPITDIENSPYYTIPGGSTITLNRAIIFPPDKVSLYIYEGELKPQSAVDVYRPHCKFELYDMKSYSQKIEPDNFTIYKSTFESVDRSINSVRYASLLSFRLSGDGGGPSYAAYTSYLYLKSEKQPNVYRLRCLHWEDPIDGVYLTVAQIRQALYGMMTLKLNDPRAGSAQTTHKSP